MDNGKIFLCNDSGVYVYDVTSGVPIFLTKKLFSTGIQDGEQLAVINDTIFVYVTWKGLVRYLYNGTLQTITEDAIVTAPLNSGVPQGMASDAYSLYIAWTKFGLYVYDKQSMAQISWYRTGFDLKGYPDIWPVTDLYCKDGYIFLNEYFGQTTILTMDSSLVTSDYFPIAQTDSNTFLIYPNPASGKFHVSCSVLDAEVKIYDLLGKAINIKIIRNSDSFVIRSSNLPNGIYFLKITTDNFSITKKIEVIK